MVHTAGFNHEPAFKEGDLELGAAVTRAWNEYVLEDWGFSTDNRIYCPLMVPFADVDLAVAEIEWGLEHGAKIVNLPVAPTQLNTSPFDPIFDPVWSLVSEADLRVAVHLHAERPPQRHGRVGRGPRHALPTLRRVPVDRVLERPAHHGDG